MIINAANNQRFAALDVLRGSTIMLMIFVNMPGDYAHIYAQLGHAPWIGCTMADLVFPFFLFTVGAAGFFSSNKYAGRMPRALLKKIIIRSIFLFIIGVLINNYPFFNTNEGLSWSSIANHWANFRVFGVLQRIGLTYCLGIILCRLLKSSGLIIFAAVSLLVISSSGFSFYNTVNPYSMLHNISQAVDMLLPGAAHTYQGFGLPFDPEGIYGTLAATVNVMIGFLAGRWIINPSQSVQKRFIILGINGLILVGCGYSLAAYIPISKALWTASYVLLASGLAIIVLTGLIYCLDIKKLSLRIFRPSLVFGANPLFLYILAEFIARSCDIPWQVLGEKTLREWQWQHLFSNITANAELNSCLFSLGYLIVYYLLAEWLFRKKIFLKI